MLCCSPSGIVAGHSQGLQPEQGCAIRCEHVRAHGDECIDPVRDEEKRGEMRGENEGEAEVPVRGHISDSQ